jgi:hypothetical protein
LVVINPEGTLYQRVKPRDVREILDRTLGEGKIIKRLLPLYFILTAGKFNASLKIITGGTEPACLMIHGLNEKSRPCHAYQADQKYYQCLHIILHFMTPPV